MAARGMKSLLWDLRVAFGFFTRLSVAFPPEAGRGSLAAAAWCFPAVGVLAGLVGAAAFGLAEYLGLPPWPSAILAVLAQVLFSGALHEDGLGDFADGLAGADPDAALRIMRDSRSGSYAICAIVFSLFLRCAALAELGEAVLVLTALVAAGSLSRSGMTLLMWRLAPARRDGLSASAGQVSGTGVAISLLLAWFLAVLALGLLPASLAGVLVLGAAVWAGRLARRRFGGQTGDVLGAVQQIGEILVLLLAVAVVSG